MLLMLLMNVKRHTADTTKLSHQTNVHSNASAADGLHNWMQTTYLTTPRPFQQKAILNQIKNTYFRLHYLSLNIKHLKTKNNIKMSAVLFSTGN